MMGFVQDPRPGGELALALPVVGPELDDQSVDG